MLSWILGFLRSLHWRVGLLRIPLQLVPGPKSLSGAEAGSWGFLSSADMDFAVPLESPEGSQASLRVETWMSTFRLGCSSSVRLPGKLTQGSEAFPRGFSTELSHVPPWCESILGGTVETVQGNQVPLEWTEIFGGLLEWCRAPGVPLNFPVEIASS